MTALSINCDMGEGYGSYRLADDAAIMPWIDLANIACGFHASDPVIMYDTVRLAEKHGVRIGAHPSLPDLQGFGRREMSVDPGDLRAMLRYQIGALVGMMAGTDARLHHIKPHGALYGMACRSNDVADAIADVALAYEVPVLGLAGTLQEKVYAARGVRMIAEFYADLDYNEDGTLRIVKHPVTRTVPEAAARVRDAFDYGRTTAATGKTIPIRAETVCVHSDNPNALALVAALSQSRQETPA